MKKTLILATLLAFSANFAMANDEGIMLINDADKNLAPEVSIEKVAPKKEVKTSKPCQKIRKDFEKKLKLTEEQKQKADEIRAKSHEQMQAIIAEIVDLKLERSAVLKSRIAIRMQQEKIAVIDAKIDELRKEAQEIRQARMNEFKEILTPKQQKQLAKIQKKYQKKLEKTRKQCEKKGDCNMFPYAHLKPAK